MTDTGTEDPMRALTRSLFASDPDETDPDEQQKPGNLVPGEGSNPTGEAHDIHSLLENLFNHSAD
jgi:hypothetical protein